MARGHPPPHCENTQVLREAITEDDDDDGVCVGVYSDVFTYVGSGIYLLFFYFILFYLFFFFLGGGGQNFEFHYFLGFSVR